MRRKEGRPCWVQARASPLFDEQGRLVWLFGVHIDITERRQAEAPPAPLMSRRGDRHHGCRWAIPAVNRAFTEITGYSAGEVLGKNPRILSLCFYDADFYQAMWRTLTTRPAGRARSGTGGRTARSTPEWLTVSRVSDDKGALNCALFADITAIKQSEQQIEYLAHHDPPTGLPNRLL